MSQQQPVSPIVINNHNNTNSHNTNPETPVPPKKDWRGTILGISLPTLLAGLLALIAYFYQQEESSTCQVEKELEVAVSMVNTKLLSINLEADDELVLENYKDQFQTYLDLDDICNNKAYHPLIKDEITKAESIVQTR